MTLRYTTRPISDRSTFTGPPDKGNRYPFKNSTWGQTLYLLEYELEKIEAVHVVMEIDVAERDLRIDGTLRAGANPDGPGVRIAFDSMHGPLIYGTDRYGWNYDDRPYRDGWQQNVRAIALGLEALRKIDRYGITKRGEQYTGWKALPSGSGLSPTGMTVDLAIEVLYDESTDPPRVGSLPPERPTAYQLTEVLRHARACTHPDRNNGDRSRWNAIDEAEQVLRRAGRLA